MADNQANTLGSAYSSFTALPPDDFDVNTEKPWEFTTDFDVDQTEDVTPQLGIENAGRINRTLATRDNIGNTSFAATLQHVQYGLNGGRPSCLIVLDFTFRFTGKSISRYSHATMEVKFSRAMDPSDHKSQSPDPEQDPKVVNIAPKEVYGIVKTVEGKTHGEISIPVMFETPVGLSASAQATLGWEKTEIHEHRTEIHGDLFWDDIHTDAAIGATWDLRENKAQRDGIFRHFRAALIVENPVGSAMWMQVVVEPSMKFSLNPAQFFKKTDHLAKLLQRNDHPLLLDGKMNKGLPVSQGVDFSSADFLWSKVVWMPNEYASQLLAQTAETTQAK